MAKRIPRAPKEVLRMLESAGFEVVRYETTGGNHVRFVLEFPGGVLRQVLCANSPGDWRSSRNVISAARRARDGALASSAAAMH